MTRRAVIHLTHEAGQKLGGIGTVLAGLVGAARWAALAGQTLLAGPHPLGDDVLADDGWRVEVDTGGRIPAADALAVGLCAVAAEWGVRIVYGERRLGPGLWVPALCVWPDGIYGDRLHGFVDHLRGEGFDLDDYLHFPALHGGVDRRLPRLIDPAGGHRDTPPAVLYDGGGQPLPGGVAWRVVAGRRRAVLPTIRALNDFSTPRTNPHLIELQVHLFAAPVIADAVAVLLEAWGVAPRDVMTVAHDWLALPMHHAIARRSAVGTTVMMAHETRLGRFLVEGGLADHYAVLVSAFTPGSRDVGLRRLLDRARAEEADLAGVFPAADSFRRVPAHRLAVSGRFDYVVAVGEGVADEMRLMLGDWRSEAVHVVPNGLPTAVPSAAACRAARVRLLEVCARTLGMRPDRIAFAAHRGELSKAPDRTAGVIAEMIRQSEREGASLVVFWLCAQTPAPSMEQMSRWAERFDWPVDHRPAPDGDLDPSWVPLWHALRGAEVEGRARVVLCNQFARPGRPLGVLDPQGEGTLFGDLMTAACVGLGLSAYEPYGLSPTECIAAGGHCLLSSSFGAVPHLLAHGLDPAITVADYAAAARDVEMLDASAMRAIEQRVQRRSVAALFSRLGPPAASVDDWLARRRAHLERIRLCLPAISWDAAVDRFAGVVEPG